MKTSFEFAEILHFFQAANPTVLQSESVNETRSCDGPSAFAGGWETVLDPAGLAYLMGHADLYTTSNSTLKTTPYNKYKTSYVRPDHVFSIEQAKAYDDLAQWAPELKSNFNFTQLKSSYRAALLKTHPDQGGSSENFWSVKKSYEVLCSLVKS